MQCAFVQPGALATGQDQGQHKGDGDSQTERRQQSAIGHIGWVDMRHGLKQHGRQRQPDDEPVQRPRHVAAQQLVTAGEGSGDNQPEYWQSDGENGEHGAMVLALRP